REEVDSLSLDGAANRKVAILQIGEEAAERARVDYRAREGMLAQRRGLLQHADAELRALTLGELRQLDRRRQPCGPRPDNHYVELHAVARAGSAKRDQQLVQREGRLISGGNDHAKCGVRSAACGVAVLSSEPETVPALDAGPSTPHSAFRISSFRTYPCSFFISSVSLGTTSNRSPTIP